jgi:LEA14-like dessication related protein
MIYRLNKFSRTATLSTLLIILTSCASFTGDLLKDPSVSVKSLNVSKFSLQAVSLDLELTVDNPNPIPLSLSQITYALNFSGESVTSGTFEKGIDIPANGSNTVLVPLNFKYQSLGNLLVSALNKSLSKDYDLNGAVKLGIFSIPFSKKGMLKLE